MKMETECPAGHRPLKGPISLPMAASRRVSLLLVILLIPPSMASGQGRAPPDQQVSPGCGPNRPVPPLPANAEQVAKDLGVLPLVQRVRALTTTCGPAELALRQQISEAVLTGALDADEVIAEISYEQDQVTEVQDRLSNAKNNKVNTLTLAATMVGSGTSAIGTGMGLNNNLAKAGDWVQVVGGGGSIILSILVANAGLWGKSNLNGSRSKTAHTSKGISKSFNPEKPFNLDQWSLSAHPKRSKLPH
jgi:hypothetical protein